VVFAAGQSICVNCGGGVTAEIFSARTAPVISRGCFGLKFLDVAVHGHWLARKHPPKVEWSRLRQLERRYRGLGIHRCWRTEPLPLCSPHRSERRRDIENVTKDSNVCRLGVKSGPKPTIDPFNPATRGETSAPLSFGDLPLPK